MDSEQIITNAPLTTKDSSPLQIFRLRFGCCLVTVQFDGYYEMDVRITAIHILIFNYPLPSDLQFLPLGLGEPRQFPFAPRHSGGF